MAMKDLHNNVQLHVALKIQEITTDTTTVGEEIDTQGFESAEFAFQTGTVTDGDYLPLLEEADDDGAGSPDTFSAVADVDLLGTEAGAGFTADTDDDKIGKLGYRGNKQWLRLSIVSTNTTSGAFAGAQAILSNARDLPKDTQITS